MILCRSKSRLSQESLTAIQAQKNVEAMAGELILVRSILRRCEALLSDVAMDARAEGCRDAACESLLADIAMIDANMAED